MTDTERLQALKDLLENVGLGLDTAHHHAAAFPSESAYGHCTWHDSYKASSGLDAAKALYEAVLPGRWTISIMQRVDTRNRPEWHTRLFEWDRGIEAMGDADVLGRSILLAVINALIVMEENQ